MLIKLDGKQEKCPLRAHYKQQKKCFMNSYEEP
jgi:hypothetical protein